MTTLTANAALLDFLRQANGPAEIRDESGKVIGIFSPVAVSPEGSKPRRVRTPEEEAAYWAELERRAADPQPGIPLRDVYKRLLAITSDETVRADLQERIDRLMERDNQCPTR